MNGYHILDRWQSHRLHRGQRLQTCLAHRPLVTGLPGAYPIPVGLPVSQAYWPATPLVAYAADNRQYLPTGYEIRVNGADSWDNGGMMGNGSGWLMAMWQARYLTTSAAENHARKGFLFCPADDWTPAQAGNPNMVQWSTYKAGIMWGWRGRANPPPPANTEYWTSDPIVGNNERLSLVGYRLNQIPNPLQSGVKRQVMGMPINVLQPIVIEMLSGVTNGGGAPNSGMSTLYFDGGLAVDVDPTNVLRSTRHAKGLRAVLYNDFHVQPAYYTWNDPRYIGTNNYRFQWKSGYNP